MVGDDHASDLSQSPFETFGALFLPVPGQASPATFRVIEADFGWRTEATSLDGVDSAVWGRLPVRAGPTRGLLVGALRREYALIRLLLRRRNRALRVSRVHRLPPASRPGMLRNTARFLLMSGMAVELGTKERVRVIDAVAEATSILPKSPVRLRSSGDGSAHATVALADGRPAFLRLARLGGLRDLARNASALRMLATKDLRATPRLIDDGIVAGTAWTLETAMPGRAVRRPSPQIFTVAAQFATVLPFYEEVAEAPLIAATALAAAFPLHSAAFRRTALAVQARVARLGSVVEHGDYWFSNLLFQDEQVVGVVDWDRWQVSGVPGTDVLHLYASTKRRTGRDLGDLFLDRVWADATFLKLSQPYWATLGIEPTEIEREAIAVAWWLSQMAAALRLGRKPAADPHWVRRNIDGVLERLAANMGRSS